LATPTEDSMGQPTTEQLREKAKRSDVTYELQRWYRREFIEERRSEFLELQRLGFEGEAITWLKSTTPDNMRYGIASKEARIRKANDFAEMAGTTLQALAEREELLDLLS
jgi:protein tyrosine phosphatase (PTP) superfamily phosphohydrolase (DUF442 family)